MDAFTSGNVAVSDGVVEMAPRLGRSVGGGAMASNDRGLPTSGHASTQVLQ